MSRISKDNDKTVVDSNFDVAIIDSWDGIGANPSVGPDSFNLIVDAQGIFGEIFESASGTQSYENPGTAITLAFKQALGFNGQWLDSAYNLGLDSSLDGIPHTANTITIGWFTGNPNFQGGPDESWAIDNIEIILNGIDDPFCIPPDDDIIGGEFLPIDSTALLLAGLQSSAIWMLPLLAGAAGVGAYYIKTRMNKE